MHKQKLIYWSQLERPSLFFSLFLILLINTPHTFRLDNATADTPPSGFHNTHQYYTRLKITQPAMHHVAADFQGCHVENINKGFLWSLPFLASKIYRASAAECDHLQRRAGYLPSKDNQRLEVNCFIRPVSSYTVRMSWADQSWAWLAATAYRHTTRGKDASSVPTASINYLLRLNSAECSKACRLTGCSNMVEVWKSVCNNWAGLHVSQQWKEVKGIESRRQICNLI